MKARNVDPQSPARDEPPTERDPFARESFTWRRMPAWRAWVLAAAAIVLAILGIIWVSG